MKRPYDRVSLIKLVNELERKVEDLKTKQDSLNNSLEYINLRLITIEANLNKLRKTNSEW